MLENILSLIYPPQCPFCSSKIKNKDLMCNSCSEKIKIYSYKTKVSPEDFKNKFISISPFLYDADVKHSICEFKFNHREDYAIAFANAIFDAIKVHYPKPKFDIVTSIPLHKSRLKERGYNQSELFAKILAKRLHVKYKRLLIKVKKNLVQHELDYTHRKSNVLGVYEAINESHIKNKRILLCDDIITSGNTMNECATVLKNSGANNIICATIAIARKI